MQESVNFFKFEKYVYICSRVVGRKASETLDLTINYEDEKGSHQSQEDLIQQGRVWLWEAINIYPKEVEKRKKENEEIKKYNEIAVKEGKEPRKEKVIASISTYTYLYLKSMYLNLNSKSMSGKNMSKDLIDEFIEDADGEDEDSKLASAFYIDNKIDNYFIKEIYKGLSEEEIPIFEALYIDNMTVREIKNKFPLYNNIERVILNIKNYIELRRFSYENCRDLCWN